MKTHLRLIYLFIFGVVHLCKSLACFFFFASIMCNFCLGKKKKTRVVNSHSSINMPAVVCKSIKLLLRISSWHAGAELLLPPWLYEMVWKEVTEAKMKILDRNIRRINKIILSGHGAVMEWGGTCSYNCGLYQNCWWHFPECFQVCN